MTDVVRRQEQTAGAPGECKNKRQKQNCVLLLPPAVWLSLLTAEDRPVVFRGGHKQDHGEG